MKSFSSKFLFIEHIYSADTEANKTTENHIEEGQDQGQGQGDSPLLDTDTREMRMFAKGLALSVAYGANIGGIATLTGTPPNLVLKNSADE